eukprot:m.29217 g.29217  ORF g.29217 m.29217 type:complete len:232 (-) comp40475_c0_seq2:61-756(-)
MSSWTQEYAKAKGKAEEAAAAINERNRLLKTNQNTTTVTNTIRRLLAEITSDLMHLEDDLSQAESRNQITPQEADRQFDLIANLKQRKQDLSSAFARSTDSFGGDAKSQLFSGPGAQARNVPAESDHSKTYRDEELVQQQHQAMKKQDDALDYIHQSARNLKNMGFAISDELDEQNDMLDRVHDGMDSTDRRLKREADHTTLVSEKAAAGGMMCCIALLILAIIVIAIVHL